ncbi:MAG: DNA polymerase III subunit beta, partial [Proteobacteria bacterium]|nr:DNA polymerase III subunit beta [Pseudomonadota bacterium]
MLTIKAGVLQNAISTVGGAINKNSEMLSAVLVKFDNGMIFHGTNMDLSIITKAFEFDGSLENFCIEFEAFSNAVKGYNADDVLELSITKSSELPILEIKKGRSSSKIQLLNVDNYPVIQKAEGTHTVIFNKEDLRNAINFTKPTIFANETRYNINGLHFNCKEGFIDVVATDGHRLGFFKIEDNAVNFERKLTIPKRATLELSKILANATTEIKMHLALTLIRFEFNNTVFTTKLIDAEFPDYNRVIPTNNNICVKVSRKFLLEAVDRVNSVFSANTADLAVNFKATENSIELNTEAGKNERKEVLEATSNDSFFTKINGNYLKD